MSFLRRIFDAAKDAPQQFIPAAHRTGGSLTRELSLIHGSPNKTPEFSGSEKFNLMSPSSTIYPEQNVRVENGAVKWLKDDIREAKALGNPVPAGSPNIPEPMPVGKGPKRKYYEPKPEKFLHPRLPTKKDRQEMKARESRGMPIESRGNVARVKIGVSELERTEAYNKVNSAYSNADAREATERMSYSQAVSLGKAPYKPTLPFEGRSAPPPISKPAPYKPSVEANKSFTSANKKMVPPPVNDNWGAMSVAGGAMMGALGGLTMVGTDTKDGGYGGGIMYGAMTGAAIATGLKYRPGTHSKGYSSFLNHQHRRASRAAALMAGGGLTSTVLAGERDHSSGFNKNRGNPIGR